jgi:hypothetical protein
MFWEWFEVITTGWDADLKDLLSKNTDEIGFYSGIV